MLSVFPLGASVEETGDVRLRFGAAQIDGMGLEDMTVMASLKAVSKECAARQTLLTVSFGLGGFVVG
jgi:hypothetical protein